MHVCIGLFIWTVTIDECIGAAIFNQSFDFLPFAIVVVPKVSKLDTYNLHGISYFIEIVFMFTEKWKLTFCHPFILIWYWGIFSKFHFKSQSHNFWSQDPLYY